ncbi:MAG: c-type cytochrome [Anaerolineaceae bacterium]|nr:MAG: c-type cytochrome [Anaerolineaceae bacterium]
MDEKDKQAYLERYEQEKKRGVPFFPDLIFKDAIVSLAIFFILLALAYFIGAPLEERADPADTTYTPRPEWYFLFLFQLLKYFPGQLEVIGVFVIPTVVLILLIALPFIDRHPRRHYRHRLGVAIVTSVGVIAVVGLTVLSIREAPPPAETAQGDQTAALYLENCAPCHGSAITVSPDTNLHALIAQGKHEDMPAWNADLTTDEIDSLVGFILSPGGSQLFTDNCGECHQAPELVAGDPIELKRALDLGPNYPTHTESGVPVWAEVLKPEERTALLNFLVAPDGQRLFAINCAPCHGQSVAISGGEPELRTIISQGGRHLEMPPWRDRLSTLELETLAKYVVDPTSVPEGDQLFGQYCSACHGERIPRADDFTQAQEIIASGGAHEVMPVWGEILTSEQLDALVGYTISAAQGLPVALGQQLYAQNCITCHGEFGEGGPNPARSGDIIPPISSAEYLNTRDDTTLRAILAQGQPNFGMSPFGAAYGGPLDDDEIDAIVLYLRSWEANPPVDLPPEVEVSALQIGGQEIYGNVCSQCHGEQGEGLIGPSLRASDFQTENTDQDIFDSINMGHPATMMIGWGEILTSEQIRQLVNYIRQFAEPESEVPGEIPSFANDVLPIFEAQCNLCHGTLGGWDGTSYDTVMNTGDHAPVVIPGDPEGSLLGQKLLGTHTEGTIMPPSGKMSEDLIAIILEWIAAGALDN